MFDIKDYNYDLPAELIAQQPIEQRDGSKLLCLGRQTGSLSHAIFSDIGKHLSEGDVLVVNNTEVIPGRLIGKKETGGKVEVLISDFFGRLKINRGKRQFYLPLSGKGFKTLCARQLVALC